MKKYFAFALLLAINIQNLAAQNITYRFANKIVTGTSVEFDVTLESDTPFKLGSGQLYINYNPAAFGNSAFALGNITVSQPAGSVLAQQNSFPLYTTFITNDNTNSRFSFSWQQGVSSGTFPGDNISSSAAILFHVVMDFVSGGSGQPDNLCFESSGIFDDQTFTACGPSSFGFADCTNFPGTQILTDNFDCSFAPLPVELVEFQATALQFQLVSLNWKTVSEFNNHYFSVERSTDGHLFEEIGRVKGAGNHDGTLNYQTLDEKPILGVNYYRLKQVDFDGKFEYSDIRSVEFERSAGQISVFPNPTSSISHIQIPGDFEQATIEVIDALGRTRFSQLVESKDTLQSIDVSDWVAGSYLLKIFVDGKASTQKLQVHKG